jgi:hypothetical protein
MADLRAGQICALLANIHRSGEDAPIYQPGDFVLTIKDDDDEPELDIFEQSAAIMALLGGLKR